MDKEKFGTKDALGNEIVMGELYGYSTNDGGWARTVVGKAVKFTPKNLLTLEVVKSQRFLYGHPADTSWGHSDKVNVRAHMTFPVKVSLSQLFSMAAA